MACVCASACKWETRRRNSITSVIDSVTRHRRLSNHFSLPHYRNFGLILHDSCNDKSANLYIRTIGEKHKKYNNIWETISISIRTSGAQKIKENVQEFESSGENWEATAWQKKGRGSVPKIPILYKYMYVIIYVCFGCEDRAYKMGCKKPIYNKYQHKTSVVCVCMRMCYYSLPSNAMSSDNASALNVRTSSVLDGNECSKMMW